MGKGNKLFWNNETPVAPLEPSAPQGILIAACRPKPIGAHQSLPVETLTTAPSGKRGHQKTLEEDFKNQERQDMKNTVKRTASGLKKWLVKHICCGQRDEEKGLVGIRIVGPGDPEVGRGIVWIDERAGRDIQGSSREEKNGCRNSRSGHSGVIVTVEEVDGP